MELHGKNIIGSKLSANGTKTFQGYNPRLAIPTKVEFHEANGEEVERALNLAAAGAAKLRQNSPTEIAGFLSTIAEEIVALGEELIEKADEESGLGIARLRAERDRTINQIKMFAELVNDGSWVDARIDLGQPDRKPLPKPDIRRMLQPVGPVVVFGASNFPLAFSVCGGDTISALAAGNPVVVKAHPAHPGTSELAAAAIVKALEKRSLDPGIFSLLHGQGTEPSIALVTHEKTKSVAFTGSHKAGRALFDAAARRREPIPVFSEMGSVNPVFLLGELPPSSAQSIAEGLYGSVLLGVGQFCTCPGLVFGLRGAGLEQLTARLSELFEQSSPGTMLNAGIAKGYAESFQKATASNGITAKVSAKNGDAQKTEGRPGLLITDAETWLKSTILHEEIFGPATIVVRCQNEAAMLMCSGSIEGSLTATVHGTAEQLQASGELLRALREKTGRLLFNGYPTGVEVGHAMQHGGPYPATTDARFTSVGSAAIYRFARPVCFQNFPDQALPPELQSANPRGIWRTVNGQLTRDPV